MKPSVKGESRSISSDKVKGAWMICPNTAQQISQYRI